MIESEYVSARTKKKKKNRVQLQVYHSKVRHQYIWDKKKKKLLRTERQRLGEGGRTDYKKDRPVEAKSPRLKQLVNQHRWTTYSFTLLANYFPCKLFGECNAGMMRWRCNHEMSWTEDPLYCSFPSLCARVHISDVWPSEPSSYYI